MAKDIVRGFSVLAAASLMAASLVASLQQQKPAQGGVERVPRTKAVKAPAQTKGGIGAGVAGGNAAPVAHLSGAYGFARSIVERFARDNATLTAAGIAFYLLLSIFPGLAALVAIYGLVGDPAEVGRQIAPFSGLLPPSAMKLLNDGLQGFIQRSTGAHVSVALATSLAIALWSARAAMSSIMVGLTIAYEETDKRSFVMQTIISLGLTLGAIVFVVVAIFSIAVVPAVLAFVHLDAPVEAALIYGRWPLLAVVLVLAFAVLYRFAPYRSHPRWRWISWGSAIATVLWLVGSVLFSFYVSHFGSYDATYGSLGAVVILLLWFWVGALIMIFGAEIDSELDLRATTGGSPLAGTPTSAGPPKGR